MYGEESEETKEYVEEVKEAIEEINAEHDAQAANEAESEPADRLFQIELTLSIYRGERWTINNVVSYALVVSPHRTLMIVVYDEDSPTLNRVILVNMDKIESVDAPYAPDKISDLLNLVETP